jgi:hypothetical protein
LTFDHTTVSGIAILAAAISRPAFVAAIAGARTSGGMSRRAVTTRRHALGLLAAGALSSAQGAKAQVRRQVDLDLALGVDASGSVNQIRFELQRRGYVEAFLDPRVLAAIKSGPRQAIGVAMYQWTGPRLQAPVVPWTLIDDLASIRDFAGKVARGDRYLFGGGTSISGAIDYGSFLLTETPFDGGRKVIDISGDGANNRGRAATMARDEAVAAGININGLPILELEPDLEDHYRSNVIGGPGAFTIAAANFEDFGNAVRRKLILEIAGLARDSDRGAGKSNS